MSAPILPKLSKYTYKKDLPFREYTLVVTPTGGEKLYAAGEPVSFRIALGNEKLRCIYGPQTYGTYEIKAYWTTAAAIATTSTLFNGSANSVFSRITTNCNGGMLEDFNKCNVYIPIVYDLTVSPDVRTNFYSFFGNSTTPIGDGTAVSANVENCKSGAYLLTRAGTIAGGANPITESPWRSFGFLLPSILGSFSKKLFPVSEIAGSNMDVDLQMDTCVNAIVSSIATINNYKIQRVRLNLSVVEYNSTITEVIRRSYNNTYVIPCVSVQTYTNQYTTSAPGNFNWAINASLKNAKGMLFSFRDASTQVQTLSSLTNRTSLGMKEAQLSIGAYTFPANRYLIYDCSQTVTAAGEVAADNIGSPLWMNEINFWMSAMKFFGVGIDNNTTCSTNMTQFNKCYNTAVHTYGTFVLAFNLEGLHENDDEFRSCMALDGNTTNLNFTTGVVSAGTTTVECFILYEFDVVISQGVAIATNKYNDFSNQQTK